MLETTVFDNLETLGITVIPIGPDSTSSPPEGDILPLVLYLRHNTQPELDFTGSVICEFIDMELQIMGNSFAEACHYNTLIQALFNHETLDGYEFTLFNELTKAPTKAQPEYTIHQFWTVFWGGID